METEQVYDNLSNGKEIAYLDMNGRKVFARFFWQYLTIWDEQDNIISTAPYDDNRLMNFANSIREFIVEEVSND